MSRCLHLSASDLHTGLFATKASTPLYAWLTADQPLPESARRSPGPAHCSVPLLEAIAMGLRGDVLEARPRVRSGPGLWIRLRPKARTPAWSDRHGRLSIRAALRSRDMTPFVICADPEPNPNAVAIGVLLDASSSMDGPKFEAAKVACAMLHLACCALGVWHAVVAFEGGRTILDAEADSEMGLARLAGLQAVTGSQVGPSYRALLEQLSARTEPTKVLIVIHDGRPDDPVSVADLNRLAAGAQVEVLGLGLALEPRERSDVHRLFGEGFIDCQSPAVLAPKLTAVLNTLRAR